MVKRSLGTLSAAFLSLLAMSGITVATAAGSDRHSRYVRRCSEGTDQGVLRQLPQREPQIRWHVAHRSTVHPEKSADLAEKVVRKLRVGLMPPVGKPKPEAATMKSFVTALETVLDKAAALSPNPGRRPFQG